MNKAELNKWTEVFDESKYPFGIYKDLIINGNTHPRKMELMGAWKTGALRIDLMGNEYEDSNGNAYSFTKRWKTNTPVGFDVWRDISANQEVVKSNIPIQFPLTKPEIVVELQERKGFGFIWTLFTLHCFYPETYPLYDQHVYRAYKYINSNNQYIPKVAPDSWEEYYKYMHYFIKLKEQYEMPFWELDKALWAYGKSIKQNTSMSGKRTRTAEKNNANLDHLNGRLIVFDWSCKHSQIFNTNPIENKVNADKLIIIN